MEFVCRVGTPSGEVTEQTFSATDEAALRSELDEKGFYVFSIRRQGGFGAMRAKRGRIPQHLLIVFGQELAALMKAGLPLLQSLEVMLERQRHPVFRESLSGIRDKVKSGVSLSDAFRAEGDLYPPILSASMVAGERSGNLEVVMRRMVQYLRLNQALKKKAISAAVYPAMLFGMMTALVILMMVRVIPQFQGFYEGLNVSLPLPTRVIMLVSAVMTEHMLWFVIAFVAAVLLVMRWFKREGSAVIVDRALLRVPYVGQLMRMYATSQLTRTLSTLLSGGLPLLSALDVAAASIGNRAMAAAVTQATPQIRQGTSLTAALESTHMLESIALEMIKVGEQTGALADMLTAISDFYDEDMETQLATVMALVEPIMLILMAVVVAGMLLAFYLPLFEAISAIQGGL